MIRAATPGRQRHASGPSLPATSPHCALIGRRSRTSATKNRDDDARHQMAVRRRCFCRASCNRVGLDVLPIPKPAEACEEGKNTDAQPFPLYAQAVRDVVTSRPPTWLPLASFPLVNRQRGFAELVAMPTTAIAHIQKQCAGSTEEYCGMAPRQCYPCGGTKTVQKERVIRALKGYIDLSSVLLRPPPEHY